MKLELIREPLITWYQKNKRDLPWRKEVTAYHVWVSEIMLQQTRVEAVKGYYERFMKEVPTISDLAQIEEDRLLKLWQGLGYYNRVRNMKKAAQKIETDYQGIFPDSYQEVLSLPGIGSYTAGAILSLAFWQPYPAVDGNVLRVLSRVLGSEKDITLPSTKQEMEEILKTLLQSSFVRDFNQGLMELGALICLPNGAPKCESCPLQSFCVAYHQGLTTKLPIKSVKNKRKKEFRTVFLFQCQDTYAILKRPSQGLLASMYEFPNQEGQFSLEEIKEQLAKDFEIINLIPLKKAKHIFTHKEWYLTGYLVEVKEKIGDYRWVSFEELENYSIPTAFQAFYPRRK